MRRTLACCHACRALSPQSSHKDSRRTKRLSGKKEGPRLSHENHGLGDRQRLLPFPLTFICRKTAVF